MQYKVISSTDKNFVMSIGYYGEGGKQKAQNRIDEGYFNRHLMPELKGTKFIVVEDKPKPKKP